MDLHTELGQRFADRRAIVLAGAGVSAAIAGPGPWASWAGLIETGIDRLAKKSVASEDAIRLLRERLTLGTAEGDTAMLIGVAEEVTQRLGGQTSASFKNWLRDELRDLASKNPAVGQAVGGLDAPVLTTNYDGLLCQTSERFSGHRGGEPGWVTWDDPDRIVRVLERQEDAVIHLHGFWSKPETVVLGIRSYDTILRRQDAQAVQQAVATLGSLVLIGTGGTTTDPNLGALFAWFAQALGSTGQRHYRLCLEDEVAELRAQGGPLIPVPYGSRYDDLAGYLATLAPGAATSGRSAPLPIAPSVRSPLRLPAPRQTFGPSAARDRLRTLVLDGHHPVAVLGGPGGGKTHHTIDLLHHPHVVARFGDRRAFVRLEGVTTEEELWTAVAAELGISGDGDLPTNVLGRLRAAPHLLVLDNAETPWAEDRAGTAEVLRHLAAVDASRLVVSIKGTDVPSELAWDEVSIEPLHLGAAREYFLAIAPAHTGDAYLDPLLDDLDGLPLAVKLVAHAARGEIDLLALEDRWRGHLADQDGDGRSLAASIALAIEAPTMTEGARRLLAVLAWLPDGAATPDLPRLVATDALAAAQALRLAGLAIDDAGRLRALNPVRLHAQGLVLHDDDAAAVLDHHLAIAGRWVASRWDSTVAAPLAEVSNVCSVLEQALVQPGAPDPEVVEQTLQAIEWLANQGLPQRELLAAVAQADLGDRLKMIAL